MKVIFFQSLMMLGLALMVSACETGNDGFDRQAWAQKPANTLAKSPRVTMANDLENYGVKVGASKDYVRELLTTPEFEGPHGDIWQLGRDEYSIDGSALHIDYDASGKVKSISIRRN